MKHFFLISLAAFLSFSSYSQAKKTDTTKGHGETAIGKIKAPSAPQFVLILNQSEVAELYNFIRNADMWSEKGRLTYLEALDKKFAILPAETDTVKKK